MGEFDSLLGGADLGGSLTSIAGGLGAVAGGADLEDVAGLVVKDVVLNLLPLYALGSVVVVAAGAIKELFGVEKRPPVLGALLAGEGGSARDAIHLTINAAIQRAAGFKRFRGPGPGGTLDQVGVPGGVAGAKLALSSALYSPHKDVPAAWWRWLVDLDGRLVDVARAGGAEALVHELETSAATLRDFHAAQELYAWALETRGRPVPKAYAWAPHGELQVLLGLLPFRAPYFLGAELPQVGGKGALLKRIGVPTYAQYAAHIKGEALEALPQAPGAAQASAAAASSSSSGGLLEFLSGLVGGAPDVKGPAGTSPGVIDAALEGGATGSTGTARAAGLFQLVAWNKDPAVQAVELGPFGQVPTVWLLAGAALLVAALVLAAE